MDAGFSFIQQVSSGGKDPMEPSFSQEIRTYIAKPAGQLLKLVKVDLSHVNPRATGSCA